MNLQCVNGELIDMDAPVYATTASNTTIPVVKHSLTTESPSAGLSEAEFLRALDNAQTFLPGTVGRKAAVRELIASHRALAQRLREAEQERDSLNQVLRDAGWGQGEIDSAASVDDHFDALKQRLTQLEARLSTVIRVSQEYADEAAQAQRRLAQLEAQDKARS